MFIICLNILSVSTHGQTKYTLRGVVIDENNQPLSSATVFLSPPGKGTSTDTTGCYSVDKIDKGKYYLSISFIGYTPHIDSVEIISDRRYDVQLIPELFDIEEVVVKGETLRVSGENIPLAVEVLSGDYLRQNLGGSLMKSLERLPGITTIEIGSGQSKPLIRGLGFNRVVVVENGIKHQAQQWGSDHGLEIDQYATGTVKIIKGPVSLLYGSDAIGGVIDIDDKKVIPSNSMDCTVDITAKTNNGMSGGSVSLFGRKERFYTGIRATAVSYGDYRVPTDSVDIYSYKVALNNHQIRNTAGYEYNLHFQTGILKPGYEVIIFASNFHSRAGFFANAHGLEPRNVETELHDASPRDIHYPYHEVNHFKIIISGKLIRTRYKLESNLGFQNNLRQEWSEYVSHGYMPATFPDTLSFNSDLEREFNKHVYSGIIKYSFDYSSQTVVSAGLSGEYQENAIGGRGFIIPAFHQFSTGSYVFIKHSFTGNNNLQIGIRYDRGKISTSDYFDWFPSPVVNGTNTVMQYLQRAVSIDRRFSNITWSAGYVCKPGNWTFRMNCGKSYRLPIAKELAANGVNYHSYSFEAGDPDLSPEISYQLDAVMEFNTDKISFGVSPFINYFENYIYLNPGSEHDRLYGIGNQVFYYTQSRVLRTGGEIHAVYRMFGKLQLGVTGEYIYSEQLSGEKKGYTLPFSPPASAIFNLKYEEKRLLFAENPYVYIDYILTAPQKNIVPPEEPTDGYQVINIGMGCEPYFGNNRAVLTFQIQNILNTKYFNHTSYYRLINLPEPGRNFILNISLPFSVKQKHK